MKNLIYVFAVWVLLNDGQLWKYPQAGEFSSQEETSYSWNKQTYSLYNSMSGELVAEIPRYLVKKISYAIPKEAWKNGEQNYKVYKNSDLDVFSDDCNEIVLDGVRRSKKDR